MGGAASAQADLEQLVACTFLLGQAMSRAFPEIYTVNDFATEDFHRQLRREQAAEARKATSKVPIVFLGPDGTVTPVQFVDKDGKAVGAEPDAGGNADRDGNKLAGQADADDDDDQRAVPLNRCLVVPFQDRQVPLERATLDRTNKEGWNVLHACAHQAAAAEAAKAVIAAYVEAGLSLEAKTGRGPGTYATGWTALHMACAYGVADTVRELIAAGAEVNVTNSSGWMPLHEAVHRGYREISEMLVRAGADVDVVIPPSMVAPYHPQFPLAHACRQGHEEVAKILIKGGAEVNAQNEGGWTALHESVFFRHDACVRALLDAGADVGRKTSQGYAVLDFETSTAVREALQAAIPLPSDRSGPADEAAEDQPKAKPEYRLLGDLPDFKAHSFMQTVNSARVPEEDADEEDADAVEARRRRIEDRKELRKKRGPVKLKGAAPPETGVPPEYACHLTGKLLADPVTTVYGNHFERNAVIAWIRSQGNLCPVTGQPLSESDCIVDKDLRIEISDWQLRQALPAASGGPGQAAQQVAAAAGDDLYDF